METLGRFASIAKNFELKNLPESEVELVGEVPFADIEPYRTSALAHIAEHLELPGFRPGKVPTDMALKKVGEQAVLEEAVELFVKDFYPELVIERKLDAVGRPDIRITKLAAGNPVGLTIRASIYPEVNVPKNWKELHAKVAPEIAEVATDEEVTKTIEDVRQSRAVREEGKEPVLPELNDEFAKSLGAFENLEALKEQIKKGIGEEKARAARERRRGKLIDALLEETTLAVPRIFIESELEKIMGQMRDDIERMGLKFDDYLKHVNKSEQAVRDDFREQAKKRAKLQLVLNKLAEDEKIEADKDMVESELKHALEHFPDAKPELVRVHVETVLRNEKILKLLEGEAAAEIK
jgi:FKBP-type peptidyl-prolyl cis-trans isomerase (trigger factor)